MSAAIAFDTHRFVRRLTASGFTEAQAEALAREQTRLLEANLATKYDLAEVKSGLEVKIEQVRAEVQTVKSSLLIWMVGALTAHLAVVIAMVQFLVRTA